MNSEANIKSLLEEALRNRFPGNREKNSIVSRTGRINIACPICGDSFSDNSKKRGNIWLETNTYKCYNCDYFSSIKRFLLTLKKFEYLDSLIPENLMLDSTYDSLGRSFSFHNVSFISNDLEDLIHEYGIEREKFKEKFNAKEVKGTRMENYLKFRSIFNFDNFLYLEESGNLIVLNRDNSSGKIISFQIRKFGKHVKNKYLSYKLSRMYEEAKMEIPTDQSFSELDMLSTYFNIINVDLTKDITYFEGPIDCYFYPNSISLNSIHAKPPFDSNHTRYFFDYDKTGKEVLRRLLKEKKTVFLWRKFLKDVKIEYNEEFGKIDFNDVFTFCLKNNLKCNYEKYFSNNTMDMIFI